MGLLDAYREGLVGIDARARVVFLGTMLSVAGRASLNTFLGIHLTRDVGMTVALVGAALLAESLMRGAVQPVAGAWSDRIGRRPAMVLGLAGAGLALPFVLLVREPWQLVLWSAANGAAAAMYFPAANALLLDVVPAPRRQAALAVNYTALSVGYTLGVVPAGFLAERSFALLVAASAASFLVGAVLVAVALRRLPRPARTARPHLLSDATLAVRDKEFLRLAAFAFVFPLGIGLLTYAVPLHGATYGVSESQLGLLLSTNGVLLIVGAIPVNARIAAAGPFRWLPLAAALLALGWAFLAWSGAWPFILACSIAFTLGELLFSSAIPAGIAELAPAASRGAYQGAWGLVFSVAFGVSLLSAGFVVERWGWRASWLVALAHALLCALGLALSRSALRRAALARSAPPT